MMNPNKLTKLSLVLLCSMIAYPAYAMEDGGPGEAGEASAPSECASQSHARYQVVSRDEMAEHDNEWRCPICFSGLDEDDDDCDCNEIIRLNCGHAFHYLCMQDYLVRGTGAVKQCLICRKEHGLRRNVIALFEQAISLWLECDSQSIEGVLVEFVEAYREKMGHLLQLARQTVDGLPEDQLKPLYDSLKAILLNPSPASKERFIREWALGMELRIKMDSGMAITKEIARETFARMFDDGFEYILHEHNRMFACLIDSVTGQGENFRAGAFQCAYQEMQEFEQAHIQELKMISHEFIINGNAAPFAGGMEGVTGYGQQTGDLKRSIHDEVGASTEELAAGLAVLADGLDQFRRNHASVLGNPDEEQTDGLSAEERIQRSDLIIATRYMQLLQELGIAPEAQPADEAAHNDEEGAGNNEEDAALE